MIYFLGGGNMASAIISGLHRAQQSHRVFVAEHNDTRRQCLQNQFGVHTAPNLPTLSPNDVLILAVKPQDIANACAHIHTNGALIVSIAAGLSTHTIGQYCQNSQRVIRVMPNTPAAIGLGVSGLFAASGTNQEDCQTVEHIMQTCGETIWLEKEEQMHHITAISGSGPAYVFYLMNALQQAAQDLGFHHQQARWLALNTFKGAVALAEQSSESFDELQNQVTSKGGTTFAALEVMRQQHLAQNMIAATQAAAARSEEMNQELN